jgi:hypothetical protein
VSLFARRVVPLTALLLAPFASTPAEAAASRQPATVVVRVYELGATRSPELTATLSNAVTRLLERVHIDVDVVFVDCAKPEACSSVARDAFVLRLVPGLHPVAQRQCGEASKGVGRQRGVLMTVFRGCVNETRRELRAGAIAQQGSGFALLSLAESEILATVVVHELIHLILPDEVHGKGLFKATLDARDWLDIVAGWPELDTALVSRLDRALADPPATTQIVAERRGDAAPSTQQQQQQP